MPRVIRLNGTLRPADRQPLAQVEILTLRIYADESDETVLWEETQHVMPDADGRYTVLLGSTQADGIPLDVFRSGEARWIGTTLERSGESEGPRIRLVSVPYALRASDADTLGGHPLSAFILAKDKSGDITASADAITAQAVSGTTNYVAKFTSSMDLGSSILYDAGGRIGLGTEGPLDLMHVRFFNTNGGLTGYAVQNMGNTATSYSGTLFYDHLGNLGQFQGFNNITHEYRINNIARNASSQFDGSINFMIGSTSRFFVGPNGNIGIGTSSPAQRLDVAGSINHTGDLRRNGLPILQVQTIGSDNNLVVGAHGPLMSDILAVDNTLVGTYAGRAITDNGANVAVGSSALRNLATGGFNTVVGTYAGFFKPSGEDNIYIGANVGEEVTNTESNTIRVGHPSFVNRAFIAGVRGVTTGASDAVTVVIDSAGQLGTINSSRRYKEDIQDMGEASSGLMKLRPVTFRYSQGYTDGSKRLDYGLIAEEVQEVYPDLVAHLANGEVETVQYHKINAMLLNEVQKQHRQIQQHRREIEALTERLAALERVLAGTK